MFGGVIIFAIMIAILAFKTGGIRSVFAYLNGRTFTISPQRVDLGDCEPGSTKVAVFHLNNFSKHDIRVSGEFSGCSCTFVEKLPVIAYAKEIIDIEISIKLPKYKQHYDQQITLIVVTEDRTLMVPVRVVAFIPNPLPLPQNTELEMKVAVPSPQGTKPETK